MRKVLAILALAIFIGGVSAPAIAAINDVTTISVSIDDPKDKKAEKKSDAKAGKDCATTKSDCTSSKKSGCCDSKKSKATAKK